MPKRAFFSAAITVLMFAAACTKNASHPNPTANAGTSQAITLPVDSATLSGTADDPGGKIKTYLWEQLSGPSSSTIVNPGALVTPVTGLAQGTYVFQLSVFDAQGGLGTDTMSIVVSPSPVHTLTLQPNNNPYEYAVSQLNGTNATAWTVESIDMDAWTASGLPWFFRAMVKFDLSQIPSTAKITSAQLYLYSDSTPITGNQHDANYGTDNSFTVQQVASDWTGTSLTWANQPAGLTANQVIVPSTTQSYLDLNIDVTAMVASMVNTNANYGFLLKLQNEVTYTSRIFVASHNTTYPNRHPKLVVTYQ